MKQRKDLTSAEKHQMVQFLCEGSTNGQLKRGRRKAAVLKFSSSSRTVTRIWTEARKQIQAGQQLILPYGKNNPRVKRVHIDLELISSLEMRKRSNQRSLAHEVGCSKTTVSRWIKKGLIKAHTNAIKPDLTAPNKLLRLRFSLEALEVDRIMNILRFKSMQNIVHIDEKWFHMTKGVHRFYITPGEAEPHRTCRNKKFITKVMFMCAVCKPMFGLDGTLIFDGKIDIFPFTQQVPAQRNSKNRAAGTMETKPITSVTKSVIRDCLINQILPRIKEKWPSTTNKHIYIQQDNAKPHIKDTDPIFREAATSDGFTFNLIQQPPNSPDTNVNDLGWFRSIECLQHKTQCVTVDQLVGAIITSFQNLDHATLNNVFLSLQGCMVEIMIKRGDNSYKVPHMGKDALIRAGTLPSNLEVSTELVRECLRYLHEAGETGLVGQISETLATEMAKVEEEGI